MAVLTTAIVVSASAALTIVTSKWVCVSDPNCGNCIMNDVDRICGKPNCKGFMAGVNGTSKWDNGYIKADYKCNKCGHTITYKNK